MKKGEKRRGWGVEVWMHSREEDRGQKGGRGAEGGWRAEGKMRSRGVDGEQRGGWGEEGRLLQGLNNRGKQLVVSRKVINTYIKKTKCIR